MSLKFLEEVESPEGNGKTYIRVNRDAVEYLMRLITRFAAYMFSIWFYLLDDVLLLVQLKLIKGKFFKQFKWAYARNIMCLGKNVMQLLCSILEVRYLRRNERKIEDTFDKHSDIILTRKHTRESVSSMGDPELA